MARFEVGGLITLQRDRFGFSCRGWPRCRADGVAARMSWLKAGRIEREVEQLDREEERNGGGFDLNGIAVARSASAALHQQFAVFLFCTSALGQACKSAEAICMNQKRKALMLHHATIFFFVHVIVTDRLSLERNEQDCVTYRKINL